VADQEDVSRSLAAELEQLATLHERGLLTEQEFATAKERALANDSGSTAKPVEDRRAEASSSASESGNTSAEAGSTAAPTPSDTKWYASRNGSYAVAVAIVSMIVVLRLAKVDATSLAVLVGVLAAYFLPTIVAHARKVPNLGSVAVINTFLGWTLIGWVVALAMAARSSPPKPGA